MHKIINKYIKFVVPCCLSEFPKRIINEILKHPRHAREFRARQSDDCARLRTTLSALLCNRSEMRISKTVLKLSGGKKYVLH